MRAKHEMGGKLMIKNTLNRPLPWFNNMFTMDWICNHTQNTTILGEINDVRLYLRVDRLSDIVT